MEWFKSIKKTTRGGHKLESKQYIWDGRGPLYFPKSQEDLTKGQGWLPHNLEPRDTRLSSITINKMFKYVISYIHFESVSGPASSAVLRVVLLSLCPAAKAETTCFWSDVCSCCTNVLSQLSMAPSHGTGCKHKTLGMASVHSTSCKNTNR